MRVALVGKPGSGKTTFFSALTGPGVGLTRREHVGVVTVPDSRVDFLAENFKPRKTTWAKIRFEDFGHFSAETFGKIRACDELVFVINNFSGNNHPLKELQELELEFNIADLDIIEKRVVRLKKEDPKAKDIPFLIGLKGLIEKERRLFNESFSEDDLRKLQIYRFFSQMPCLIVVNSLEETPESDQDRVGGFREYCNKQKYAFANLSAVLEKEISELPLQDQKAFLADYGLKESARNFVIRKSYELLGLITFFTVGSDEVRAWTIPEGLSAKKAAGKIHSDLERGFIRAEVIGYEIFREFGNMNMAKSAGKLRVEGRDYIVQDGEILNIRFNV